MYRFIFIDYYRYLTDISNVAVISEFSESGDIQNANKARHHRRAYRADP